MPAKQHIPLWYHGTAPFKVSCKLADRIISVARQKLETENWKLKQSFNAIAQPSFRCSSNGKTLISLKESSVAVKLFVRTFAPHVFHWSPRGSLFYQHFLAVSAVWVYGAGDRGDPVLFGYESVGQATDLIQFCLASRSTGVKLQPTNVKAHLYLNLHTVQDWAFASKQASTFN